MAGKYAINSEAVTRDRLPVRLKEIYDPRPEKIIFVKGVPGVKYADIIDAMDLRAFGVGPRRWLDQLTYHTKDRLLIAFGVLILVFSLAVGFVGIGKFWVPPELLRLAVGG